MDRVYEMSYETETVTCRSRAAADSQTTPYASSSAASQGESETTDSEGCSRAHQGYSRAYQGYSRAPRGHNITQAHNCTQGIRSLLLQNDDIILSFCNQVLRMVIVKSI